MMEKIMICTATRSWNTLTLLTRGWREMNEEGRALDYQQGVIPTLITPGQQFSSFTGRSCSVVSIQMNSSHRNPLNQQFKV